MITSARGRWPGDVIIRNWSEAGLTVPCKVRLKLFTLRDDLIVRGLGALTPRDRRAVADALPRSIAAA